MATSAQQILFKRGKKAALVAKLVGENRPALGEPVFEAPSESAVEHPKLKIGDGIHDYADLAYVGYEVIANPDEEATVTLTKIKIDGVIYELKAGGGTDVVDEDNFIFKEDLITMYNVGKIEATADNPATIEAKGKSFKQVWNEMFVNILEPEVVQPFWTVSYSNSDVTGAYITPTATFTFNPGSYSYGPATGVSVTSLTINDVEYTLQNNSVTITLDEQIVGTTDNFELKYSYSGAANPKNNVGQDMPDMKIADVADATANYTHTYASTGNLTISVPTVSVSVSTVAATEAGTVVTPTYTISLANPTGKYPYKSVGYSDTSANVSSSLTKSIAGSAYETATTGTFNFEAITLTDSAQSKAITAKVDYTDSDRVPLSANGNRVPSKQIAAGTNSASKTLSIPAGYRNIFWGYASTADINSDVIRGLQNKKNAALTDVFLGEDTTAKCIVISAPTGTRTMTKVTMPSSSEADVTTQFVKQSTTIAVEGANGFTAKPYDVWIYSPAEMGGTYKINMK